MATQTILTLDQFLALPEDESVRHELSEGELITLPPLGYRHGVIVMNIGYILRAALDGKKFIITGGDAGFILSSKPESATVRGADVAVNKRAETGPIPNVGYLTKAPFLAVEVVSPGNTVRDMELKVNQYLKAGGEEVWLVYPDSRRLYLYVRGRRDARIFEDGESFQSVVGCDFAVTPFFEI